MESLYEQVKIVVVATAIFLMILLLTIVMYLSQDRRILITRDETGGETTEKQIRIKTKKDDDIYSLTIRPKGYTKSRIFQCIDLIFHFVEFLESFILQFISQPGSDIPFFIGP